MAYRLSLLLAVALLACGDDSGSNHARHDASVPDGRRDDAALDGPPGMTVDAAVGPACNTMTCSPPEVCCASMGGGTCVAAGTCIGTSFTCDGPEDCAATEVCCFTGNGLHELSECAATQDCVTNGCHADSDCSSDTPRCCPIENTPYKICRPLCPVM